MVIMMGLSIVKVTQSYQIFRESIWVLEFCSILCTDVALNRGKKKSKDNANRIKEESERNYSSRSGSTKTLSKG